MTTKIIVVWKPDWKEKLGAAARSGSYVMGADSLTTARRIRQQIQSTHDIHNAFDTITYSKGAAVLAMLEQWVGERPFQKGLRQYLTRHAWGNATAADLIAAEIAAAGRDLMTVFAT